MRALIFGLLAGFLLSVGRAPTGFDLFELPAPFAATRYGGRALALALIGLALTGVTRAGATRAGERTTGTSATILLLTGTVLGYATHGLLFADGLAFDGHFGLVTAALVLFVLLRAARPLPVASSPDEATAEHEPDAPGALELLGIAAAGAGCAIALEGAARFVTLMSDGARDDGTGFALAFLLATWVGAAAFGAFVSSRPLRHVAFPVGLAAVAAAALASLGVLGNLSSPRGLFRYFHHPVIELTGVDSSHHGMLSYDILLGASCFVIPGMLLGAVLCSSRHRARLGTALLGAGLGLALVPVLLSATGVEPYAAERSGRIGSDLVGIGALLAGAGAALAALVAARTWTVRLLATALALAAGSLPLAYPVEPAIPVAPWRKVSIPPRLMFETREGLFTLEGLRFGVESVTLNRRVLAPGHERAHSDVERLRVSMQLCDPFKRARQEIRVLLIGQLTPGRGAELRSLGAARIDRSASWWRAMETLEHALFQDEELPPGDILEPCDARERARRGDYDLVLVPPIAGDAPRAPGDLSTGRWLDLPDDTVAVVWVDLRFASDHVAFGDRVLLVTDGVAGLGVGVVHGAVDALAEGLLFLPIGGRDRLRPPLPRMLMRSEERSYGNLQRFSRRLMDGARDEGGKLLPRALEQYFGAQRRSSPFEDPTARIELPSEALDALREHTLGRPLDDFTRDLWEEIAAVLHGKRWIPEIIVRAGRSPAGARRRDRARAPGAGQLVRPGRGAPDARRPRAGRRRLPRSPPGRSPPPRGPAGAGDRGRARGKRGRPGADRRPDRGAGG